MAFIFNFFWSSRPSISIDQSARAERILQKALSSTAIKELYDRAVAMPRYDGTAGGNLHITFVTDGYKGCANNSQRKIELLSSLSDDEALSVFVFELTNILHGPEFYAVYLEARSSNVSCEDFVRKYEQIEWEGCLLHHRVMQAAIKEMKWSQSLDVFSWEAKISFRVKWIVLQFSPHANYYRKCWRKMTGRWSMPIFEIGIVGGIGLTVAVAFLVNKLSSYYLDI